MTHQPIMAPTDVRLASQPKTVEAPLETVIKVKREKRDWSCTHPFSDPLYQNKNGTHAESDGNKWKTLLCDSAKDFGGLTTDGEAEQNSGGSV